MNDLPMPGAWRFIARRYLIGVVVVLLFGVVRMPFERSLAQARAASSLNSAALDLSLREKVTQNEFIAALGGFRSLVADVLWIEAMTDWEKVEYGKMNVKFGTVTTLVPHNTMFWEMAGWHMAYNASVAVMEDQKEPKIALRKKRQREYFLLGKDYIERGIANNPQSATLYHQLGEIYQRKLDDHLAAYEAYTKAAACPHAMGYEKRMAAYELAKAPGKEREAWKTLRALYDLGEQERLPTLEKDLRTLESKLNLPQEQRVYKTP